VPEAEVNLGLIYWPPRPLGGRARRVRGHGGSASPGNLSAQLMLGQVLNRLNRPRDALLRLQPVVEVQPENSAAWFDIGEAHKALAQQAVAVAAFRKVDRDQAPPAAQRRREIEAAQSELQLLESQAPRAPGG
jgi:predicted Zn-dependent protease